MHSPKQDLSRGRLHGLGSEESFVPLCLRRKWSSLERRDIEKPAQSVGARPNCPIFRFWKPENGTIESRTDIKAAIPRGWLGSQGIMLEAHYIAPRSIRCGGFFLFWGRDSGEKMRY